MHLARVVTQLEAHRVLAGEAGLGVQALRLAYALGERRASIVEGLRGVVIDPGRHPPPGRQLPHPQYELRELVAVDDERERAAELQVVAERGAPEVEAVVVGGELRKEIGRAHV